MPVPGTDRAPLFTGDSVRHFLQVLIELGANVGIPNRNDLVPYILRYSSNEVKSIIQYLPEFDRDIPNKKWSLAEATLILIYGSSDDILIYGSFLIYGSSDEPEIPMEANLIASSLILDVVVYKVWGSWRHYTNPSA